MTTYYYTYGGWLDVRKDCAEHQKRPDSCHITGITALRYLTECAMALGE
jgi:hypothetical protein